MASSSAGDVPGWNALKSDTGSGQKIVVRECGVEPGKIRYPRNASPSPPQPYPWRNNLTALSQYRNLYFVAFGDKIHVYQPGLRAIGVRPRLILSPCLKQPNALGYMPSAPHHGINHIVIGNLGTEEILVLATDSGNVAAYRTEHIHDAIEQLERSELNLSIEVGPTFPYLFIDWVGMSAWGLAIHTEARMIAASCNTYEITVWAFALVDKANTEHQAMGFHEDPDEDEWTRIIQPSDFEQLRRLSLEHRRSRNFRITLNHHPNNVPSVCFLNSALDPDGEWLVSTDITNRVFAWRVWEDALPVTVWNMNPTRRHSIPYDIDRGWGVLALDPGSFRIKSSISEACGGEPRRHNSGYYDLTNLIADVPNASTKYHVIPKKKRQRQIFHPTTVESDIENVEEPGADTGVENLDHQINDSDDDDDFDQVPLVDALLESIYGPTEASSPGSDSGDEDDSSVLDEELMPDLPDHFFEFPILHFSETNIRMLVGPYSDKSSAVCRMALRQSLPDRNPIIEDYDRLNMIHQIPELGIVVAGAQKGRVAIISLTEVEGIPHTMRVDHILPFESQENDGLRPLVPLLGVAVGPVTSNLLPIEDPKPDHEPYCDDWDVNMGENEPSTTPTNPSFPPRLARRTPRESWHGSQYSRRYRLILMYQDHTVLRYELYYGWPKCMLRMVPEVDGTITLAP